MSGSVWILLLADLHLGSAYSLWPPDFRLSTGALPNLNIGQEYLYSNWCQIEKAVKKITGGHLDILVVDGDAVHGKNQKNNGEYLIESSIVFQGKAVVNLLKKLADISDSVLILRGSRYHVGEQAETEEWIGCQLGSIQDDVGHHCWMWVPDLDVEGVVLDIAHHQSAVMINRGMPLERERRFANQMADLRTRPDLIIRAHGHVGSYQEIDGEAQLGLYPLQLQTPYAKQSKTPNRLLSRYLGAWLLEIIPSRKGTVLQPFQLHPLRFKHPPLPKVSYSRRKKSWIRKLKL